LVISKVDTVLVIDESMLDPFASLVGAARSQRLAIFDLDRTLVPGSSLVTLGRALVAHGLVSRRRLAGAGLRNVVFQRFGSGDSGVERIRDRALAVFAGVERVALLWALDDAAQRVVADVTPSARALLDQHLDAGDFCVVLSASPHELVERVSGRLGAHRGAGTRAEVVDGRLSGRLDGAFCYGAGKLPCLVRALGPVDLSTASAYSDSISDRPLLEACGHPVAVNPDRKLRRLAEAEGWPLACVA